MAPAFPHPAVDSTTGAAREQHSRIASLISSQWSKARYFTIRCLALGAASRILSESCASSFEVCLLCSLTSSCRSVSAATWQVCLQDRRLMRHTWVCLDFLISWHKIGRWWHVVRKASRRHGETHLLRLSEFLSAAAWVQQNFCVPHCLPETAITASGTIKQKAIKLTLNRSFYVPNIFLTAIEAKR